MVDHLKLINLDQLLFILKMFLTFFTKQATLMRRSTVLTLPPHLVFPGLDNQWQMDGKAKSRCHFSQSLQRDRLVTQLCLHFGHVTC
jgi:hypothetical protein